MNDLVEQQSGGMVVQPSSALPSLRGGGALATVEAQRAVAEMQAAIFLAKQFPRDRISAVDAIRNECTRPNLAAVAEYAYSRGGSEISGPSIRLVEMIAQNWGNLKWGWKEVSRSNGISEIKAFAWDMQSNSQRDVEFQVRHIRDTKKGQFPIKEEREIYELCANQAARRVRACLQALIPGDVIEAATEECTKTLSVTEKITPDSIAKMVKAFEDYGVTKEQIAKRIQKHVEAINPGQMIGLRKIYNSLKDGMSVAGDWFEVIETGPAPGSAAAAVDALAKKANPPKTEAAPKSEPAAAPNASGSAGPKVESPDPRPGAQPSNEATEPPRDGFGLPPVESETRGESAGGVTPPVSGADLPEPHDFDGEIIDISRPRTIAMPVSKHLEYAEMMIAVMKLCPDQAARDAWAKANSVPIRKGVFGADQNAFTRIQEAWKPK